MTMIRPTSLAIIASLLVGGCTSEAPAPTTVNEPVSGPSVDAARAPARVYTSANLGALREVMQAYRAETGLRTHWVNDELRVAPDLLRNPEQLPQTDLLIADNFAEIWTIAEADKLRPTVDENVDRQVPAAFRDPESRWAALAVSARIVAINRALVGEEELVDVSDYAALGHEKWRDRLCVSSSRLGRNRTLVAHLIKRHGVREAEIIVREWRANFGQSVYVSDAALIAALDTGECAIAIVDSGAFAAAGRDDALDIHWFADLSAVSFDVIAAGVSRHAANSEAARELFLWLTAPDAGALMAFEMARIPANSDARVTADMQEFADRIKGSEPLADVGYLQEDAVKLIERARYP